MFLETKKDGEVQAKTIEPWRQLLMDAARYIDRHGWCQRRIGTAGGHACAVGALWMAYQGSMPRTPEWDKHPVMSDAVEKLCIAVKASPFGGVAQWNDTHGRVQDEVVSAMRACANSYT